MNKYDEIEEIKKSNGLSRIQILTPTQLEHLRAEPTGQFHHEDETMIFEKPNQTKNRKTNLKIFRQNKIPLF